MAKKGKLSTSQGGSTRTAKLSESGLQSTNRTVRIQVKPAPSRPATQPMPKANRGKKR